MEDQLITFETAKLAKEKGFGIIKYNYIEWKDAYYVCDEIELARPSTYINKRNGELIIKRGMGGGMSDPTLIAAAPTQSLLQKWLRENFDIQIQIFTMGIYMNKSTQPHSEYKPSKVNDNEFFKKYMFGLNADSYDSKYGYDTYEEALEEGLLYALKIIK